MQLSELVIPLSLDEARLAIYNVLAATGVTTTNWRPGAVVRTIITAVAVIAASLSSLIALVARSGFLALSSGAWLTLVARYCFGTERIPATFATGEVTLTNSSGGNYPLDPGDLTVSNPITGAEYFNTELITLNAGTTVTAAFQALVQGSGSTSFSGEVTRVTSGLTGVSCTNANALAGYDEESDSALRSRSLAKLGSLSPMGPRDAYDYAARSALRADGTQIGVTRTKVVRLPNGYLNLYVAGSSGAITGSDVDPLTDLGAVSLAVQRNAAPQAITVNVLTVANAPITIQYSIWLYNTTSMSPADIVVAIETRLQEFVAAQPIGGNVIEPAGGKLYLSAIEAAIGSTTDSSGARLPIFRIVLAFPTADLELAPNQVAALSAVTAIGINIVGG